MASPARSTIHGGEHNRQCSWESNYPTAGVLAEGNTPSERDSNEIVLFDGRRNGNTRGLTDERGRSWQAVTWCKVVVAARWGTQISRGSIDSGATIEREYGSCRKGRIDVER